jgi:RHH-type transcriptional regulator, proline utilization regulon repressor / proline dehydrogenase / delta 1-pyrroline-5-carboxylate dehydrogenase
MQRLPNPYRAELTIVLKCLSQLQNTPLAAQAQSQPALDWPAVQRAATPWVQAVRQNPPPFWAMESLLKEYPISSAEGLALMRLAEALLRVPDAQTAIALTADQLGRADFGGASEAVLARLSSAAISMSKHFLPENEAAPGLMAKLGAKTVVAATLRAVQLLGKQFVLGQSIGEALQVATAARKKTAAQAQPTRYSFDMLGEGARTQQDADAYFASYLNAIESIAKYDHMTMTSGLKIVNNAVNSAAAGLQLDVRPRERDGISIKLSALHPRYEWSQQARVMNELVPRVWQLCECAARAGINLTIDAEEVERLELSLDVFEALLVRVAAQVPTWTGFGLALQAYQTRAVELVDHVVALARKYRVQLMCRLVKGAYWDAEIKRAQELGLAHYPVFTHKNHTDVSYLACARALLAASDCIYPQFATHNAGTIAAIAQMGGQYELQRLHGMGEGVYREAMQTCKAALRIYAPVGAHRDLLAYLVRRLLENGANSSFVHQITDESVGMDVLLTSPLYAADKQSLPLPPALFGAARVNSAGIDLASPDMRAPLMAAWDGLQVPAIFPTDGILIKNRQCLSDMVIVHYKKWSNSAVSTRATILRNAATVLELQTPKFCALLVKEAFKTWGDALGEVREAVDFLRYYANEAERIMQPQVCEGVTGETNTLSLRPRGTWVCISPWNFPLAIFTGQVAAALVTGNAVLAKPAEQTPAVAFEMVKILHDCGVPAEVLQCFHGAGDTVGAGLVALPYVAGVVFTGSTQVARTINRALAAKDGPIAALIAETGGINAMLVDSSALPEQVCDAVIQSAFKSAGQRCSALRLLCVHEAIADKVIEMVEGAASELVCGDSSLLETDVGAVIDKEAYDGISQHIKNLQFTEKKTNVSVKWSHHTTNTIVPSMFEVATIDAVKAEIFGPVLQIVRWGSGDLADPQAVIERINALGYGLTLGIQTRIDSRADALAQAAHTGNVYINRNMIGAVVGSQPFGGQGLSGTGPKAGGPHYLQRFCTEQTVTINTAAAGGNATLLAAGH